MVILTPVIFSTVSGRLPIISRISPVILLAPIGPSPELTIVIFFVWEIGALTSAATCGNTWKVEQNLFVSQNLLTSVFDTSLFTTKKPLRFHNTHTTILTDISNPKTSFKRLVYRFFCLQIKLKVKFNGKFNYYKFKIPLTFQTIFTIKVTVLNFLCAHTNWISCELILNLNYLSR